MCCNLHWEINFESNILKLIDMLTGINVNVRICACLYTYTTMTPIKRHFDKRLATYKINSQFFYNIHFNSTLCF